jgi:hypothetical protein
LRTGRAFRFGLGGPAERLGGQAALFEHLGRFVERLGLADGDPAGAGLVIGGLAPGEQKKR